MLRRAVGLCLLVLAPAVAWSADLPAPPSQRVLRLDPSGHLQMLVQAMVCKFETRTGTNTKKVPETKLVKEEIDGKVVEKAVTQYRDVKETYSYTVCVPDYQTIAVSVDMKSVKAYETDGRRIPTEKLSSRVPGETLVVVSATDAMLPEAYASLFKPGTIILTTPAGPTPASAAPASTTPPSTAPVVPMPAAKRPELPKSPAPLIVNLSREGIDKLHVRRLTEKTSSITGAMQFKKGSTKEQTPVQMSHFVRQMETFTLKAEHVRFGLGGTAELSWDRAKEKLSRDVAVLYSADGDDIDPFWLQNLKSTTLVVTGPQLPMPGSSSPAPVMMPAPTSGPYAPATAPVPVPVQPAPAPNPMPLSSAVRRSPVLSAVEAHIPFEPSTVERELVALANTEREKANLAPLILEQQVTLTARTHAANMMKSNSLSHELDGQGAGERLSNSGFRWIKCGENIARGQDGPREAIESWMNSPGHRANLLGATYTHIGVACSQAPDGQKSWTMVLAQAR